MVSVVQYETLVSSADTVEQEVSIRGHNGPLGNPVAAHVAGLLSVIEVVPVASWDMQRHGCVMARGQHSAVVVHYCIQIQYSLLTVVLASQLPQQLLEAADIAQQASRRIVRGGSRHCAAG